MSHTYAVLVVSEAAYDEIRELLKKAGYEDQFCRDGNKEVIDMQGIALARLVKK